MEKDLFKEYIKESEPDKASKGYVWSTAIGLQAVDGLKPSKYLIDTAIQNIEGNITLKEAQNSLTVIMNKSRRLRTVSVPKKRIRYRHELREFCRRLPFHFHQMSISLSTAGSFEGYMSMQEKSGIII